MQYYNNGLYNPPYQQQITPINSQQPQNSYVLVQGGEEVAISYPVAPGNSVAIISLDKSVMFIKTTDFSGRPQPMQTFYLVSKEDYEKIQNGKNFSQNKDSYLTKEEFEKYVEEAANKFVIRRKDK